MFPIPVPIPIKGDQKQLDDALNKIAALREQLVDLERRSERQSILLHALFLLLQEKEEFSESQLLERFRQLETSQAVAGTSTKLCHKCNRPVSLKHQRCLYCETPYEAASAFDLL